MGLGASTDATAQRRDLRRYLDFLFSEENWSRDLYLQRLSRDNGGAVPVGQIIKFSKAKAMLDAVLGAGSSEEDRIRELCLSLTPESSLEIVQDRSGPTLRPPGLRRKELRLLVREYFEFLFGPLNYATDEYLIDLESDDGWVEITDIMKWPRLRTLVLGLTRAEEIARTLVEPSVSPIVEVSPHIAGGQQPQDEGGEPITMTMTVTLTAKKTKKKTKKKKNGD